MKKYLFTTVCTALLFACKGPAENASNSPSADAVVTPGTTARIDSLLQDMVARGQVAGISALVYEKGQEAYFGAYGYADREDSIPMARNTIVQIYSMTKPITGTALMTLYETGAFQLDDPLTKYAPEFGDMQVYTGVDGKGRMLLEPVDRPITIRDITRHTTGFPNRPDIPGLSEALAASDPLNRENTLQELGAKFGALPLWFQPGSQWEYGPSVDVQAFMVERISGQPYGEYVREKVLDPLGMEETRYYVPEEDRGRFSAMYRLEEDATLTQLPDSTAKIEQLQRWPLTRGGWGLTSTLDDYMRFTRMLLGRGTLDSTTILRPETVQLMATNHLPDSVEERSWLPSKGSVGFGIDFAVRVAPPANAEENNGVVGEFFWDGAASTLFWIDPVNELSAVLFVQLFPYDPVRLHKKFRDAVYGPYKPAPDPDSPGSTAAETGQGL
ncbi:serine hydrolase [Robiginitalea sp. SC105]|uniref:serine hydrolase domain-containing protein n=1 Tax=Robiginitalea sp. SC105 TaxID=2762332 RepID=UPI00163A1AEF|nr:serine hydrolase domain-containing protein [Robiginitalea sp. SC105]MBC2839409.1 beta-lactamase family protein [Robiginitalea sp. SC105]